MKDLKKNQKPHILDKIEMRKSVFAIILFTVILTILSCSSEDDSSNPPQNNTIEVSIDEYPTTGDIVTTVTSNLSGSLTYTITSQSIPNAFDISSSGELRVLAWQLFDFETTPVITVTADVTNDTETENKIIIVSINNIDDIAAFLTGSLSAYNNATAGEWVKILQSEYNDLANNLFQVTKSGQFDDIFNNSQTISTGGANYTVTNNNTPTMEEGSYLFAFRYYTSQNNTTGSNVKISETSYQSNFETVGSNLPMHDSGYNYFVLKGSNSPTSATAYLGIYESNTIGFKSVSGSNSYFFESGDVTDLTNNGSNRRYLYQGLSTTLKQWD